ncbi:hypothetical protein FG386_002675 [Cryptosporidium ryanae]|uniref:uncharacterized protein n=1 Tax=Cryptosporidium ryanae TaxID=515981 RepID=UPI00351A0B21|nr:hypothetical protein FG386_002675 [Cryptosporidium ryanae]
MKPKFEIKNEAAPELYYVPPFKKRKREKAMFTNNRVIQEKFWKKLEKDIKGEINKLNFSNIEQVLISILKNNIVRGRGILANCIIKAQLSSQFYTPVISCLSAILNCNIPDFGSLLVRRLINQFKKSFEISDILVCKCTILFLAQLISLRVLHELTGLQICLFLTEKFTDSSIELCVCFIQECGEFLLEFCQEGLTKVLNELRVILQEGKIKKRTQFLIQDLLRRRRRNFIKSSGSINANEFIDTNDQITHFIDILDDELDLQENLDYFTEVDHEIFEKENKLWEEFSNEMVSGLAENERTRENVDIFFRDSLIDFSDKEVSVLRKQIYLCIMNSLSFEECTHRLLKLDVHDKLIDQVSSMLLECCSMERTYQKFFALAAERLCKLRDEYKSSFTKLFTLNYETAHRLETNKLRQVTKLFSYLLSKDAIPWDVLEIITLSEQETASSSRIFIKILFIELFENMGIQSLDRKLNSEAVIPHIEGIFPSENLSRIRFSINFFTAIGLNGLTTKLREKVKSYEEERAKKLNELYFESFDVEKKGPTNDLHLLSNSKPIEKGSVIIDYYNSGDELDISKNSEFNKLESCLETNRSMYCSKGEKRRKNRSFSRE